MSNLPLLVLTLLGCSCVLEACSPLPGWVPQDWSIVPMLTAAPYVVYVQGTGQDDQRNIANLTVLCVLKSPTGETVPDVIFAHDVVIMHSCLSNPYYVLGDFYVFALEKATYFAEGYPRAEQFKNFEPDISTRNMYESTAQNLDDAFNVCGMNPRDSGVGSCPAYNVRNECSSPTVPPTTTTTAHPPTTTTTPPIEPPSHAGKLVASYLTVAAGIVYFSGLL